jgi:hypothetical protein
VSALVRKDTAAVSRGLRSVAVATWRLICVEKVSSQTLAQCPQGSTTGGRGGEVTRVNDDERSILLIWPWLVFKAAANCTWVITAERRTSARSITRVIIL